MTRAQWLAEAALAAFLAVSVALLELGRWLDNRSARRAFPRPALPSSRPRRDAGRAISHVTVFSFYDQDAD